MKGFLIINGVPQVGVNVYSGGTAGGALELTQLDVRTAVQKTLGNLVVTHTSPVDGTVTYTSNVTVTCSGFPFTVDDTNCFISHIIYRPTGGSWTRLVNGLGGVSLTASSGVITVAGAATPFAAGDTYRVGICYQGKAYSLATNSNRSEFVNPVPKSQPYDQLVLVNITANTTGYFYVDMEGYENVECQIETSDTAPTDTLTLTLELSDQNNGTTAASCVYQDRTLKELGFASLVDTDDWWRLINIGGKNVRIKYVTSDTGGNDADLTIYCKKW